MGATGTVGREVALACRGRARVVAFCRDPERAADILPKDTEIVRGDILVDDDVGHALEGVSAAFYVSPHIPEEEACAARFVASCNERGIRLVFVGSHVDGGSRLTRWVMGGLAGLLMKPYRAKFRLSERARSSGGDVVVLAPTNFSQNDELNVVRRGLLEEGVYRYPVGARGMNRLDVRDLAEVAARALIDRDVAAGGYSIAGPASLTGEQCAAAWASALGRPIRYEEQPEIWERGVTDELDGKKRQDFLATWRALARFGVPTLAPALAVTTTLLGRAPTTYERYVERTAHEWRKAA
jgi:uncharacterized protein YbjT (DUF2867 family)